MSSTNKQITLLPNFMQDLGTHWAKNERVKNKEGLNAVVNMARGSKMSKPNRNDLRIDSNGP